ncbi:hypothetical protein [Erythrobacter sp. SG61-1L]|uniref:hypothetical protein n=1 Tax=Erythrobacter sp. SG61-1L TaxID=1603897 RepID=UPI0006C9373F|nr:hypothetical protein [Erythrobacter sp. SG61-1L]
MTHLAKSTRRPRRYVPAFVPVPLRARADGWTPGRQAAFLGYLAQTRSVSEAARLVGMARETAYRLRGRRGAESFAVAWDVAMGRARGDTHRSRKVTGYELEYRAFHGALKPVLYRGRFTAIARKPGATALLRLVARPWLGLAGAGPGQGRDSAFRGLDRVTFPSRSGPGCRMAAMGAGQ